MRLLIVAIVYFQTKYYEEKKTFSFIINDTGRFLFQLHLSRVWFLFLFVIWFDFIFSCYLSLCLVPSYLFRCYDMELVFEMKAKNIAFVEICMCVRACFVCWYGTGGMTHKLTPIQAWDLSWSHFIFIFIIDSIE